MVHRHHHHHHQHYESIKTYVHNIHTCIAHTHNYAFYTLALHKIAALAVKEYVICITKYQTYIPWLGMTYILRNSRSSSNIIKPKPKLCSAKIHRDPGRSVCVAYSIFYYHRRPKAKKLLLCCWSFGTDWNSSAPKRWRTREWRECSPWFPNRSILQVAKPVGYYYVCVCTWKY